MESVYQTIDYTTGIFSLTALQQKELAEATQMSSAYLSKDNTMHRGALPSSDTVSFFDTIIDVNKDLL